MPAIQSILVLCILVAASSLLSAAENSPYEAYVCVDHADVVAGPGHRYYTTDRLEHGTKVEIYREEASGWLAIRPPEGSFSWVPSEYIERLDDDQLGKVKQPTGSWIGTTTEHVQEHHQQVTLKAGELVRIEAEKSIDSKSGTNRTWLKIAPPAGEYRWIHLRDVTRQKPVDPPSVPEVPAEMLTRAEPEPRRFNVPGGAIAIREVDKRGFREDRSVEPAQYRSPTNSTGSLPASSDGFVARKRRDSDQGSSSSPPISTSTSDLRRPRLDPPPRLATSAPLPSSPPRSQSTTSSGLSSEEISRQLEQIEVDLSSMVARDHSEWNLPALRRRVETLVESGADPIARGRARITLDKIKQFEDTFHSTASVPNRSSSTLTTAIPEKSSASASLADPRYDAQGWLKPVISRKGDKPAAPYAVVDSEGQPLAFISPSPGLNLNRYLNKQIGLYGRRGYLEELKRPHVVAERVVELDTKLR